MALFTGKLLSYSLPMGTQPLFILVCALNVANSYQCGSDVFLYGFIVPILPYMLEDRSGLDPSKTQSITFALLSESALVGVVASPFIGQLADRTSHKKRLLLYSLGAAMGSSLGLALSRSGMLNRDGD